VIQAAEQDVFVTAKTSISLICGKSSIVLLADGTVQINGVKGLVNFTDNLDQRGGKIFLNCDAPVGAESPQAATEENLAMPAPATAKDAPASSSIAPMGPWKPMGLGAGVDGLAARSPTMQKQWAALKDKGWQMVYGPAGGGSYVAGQVIVIDGEKASNPYAATTSVAHELGHASSKMVPDMSSKQAFLNSRLDDEGAAAMNQIRAQREIWLNTDKKINIMSSAPAQQMNVYNAAFDKAQADGNWAAANRSAGKYIGTLLTSTTKEPYVQYYGNWYDKSTGGK